MGKTHIALMARGVDDQLAKSLEKGGWTISKLKQEQRQQLEKLGLAKHAVDALYSEVRPPIPTRTLTSVLFASRFQCCVCRDPNKAIIVHHIDEWSNSRSHAASNLAVLCLEHHERAHAKSELAQNLDAKALQKFKTKWEEEVKTLDSNSILKAMRLEYSSWNYFNELRLFEMARELKIDLTEIEYFYTAKVHKVVGADGIPIQVSPRLSYKYEGPHILTRYFYVRGVMDAVIERIGIINISDHLDKGVLSVSLATGDIIFVQGSHIFSPVTKKREGQGQICTGSRSAHGVEVRFTFDRWEATSSSAWACWLVGTRNQGSLIQVKNLSRDNGKLVIEGTVIGIALGSQDLKTRDYDNKWLEYVPPNGRSFSLSDDDFDPGEELMDVTEDC